MDLLTEIRFPRVWRIAVLLIVVFRTGSTGLRFYAGWNLLDGKVC